MNSTATGMKNMLEGVNSSVVKAKERISELEDRVIEIAAMKQDKQKWGQKLTDIENKLMVTKGETGGGKDKFGTWD